MAKVLTDRAIKTVKPRPTRFEIHDGKTAGLYLVVQPTGAKSWAFRYRRPNGKPAKLTIGPLEVYGLKEARAEAQKAARAVTELRDPAIEKKAARAAAKDPSDLIDVLLDDFIVRHVRAKNRARTAEEVERIIRLHVKPAWSDRKIGSITSDDVHDLLERVGSPVAKNRVFATVRKFFNWAIGLPRPHIRMSPAAGIKAPSVESPRDRVLSDGEIGVLWHATEGPAPLAMMTRLLLLTGQRRTEVAGMTWGELTDLDSAEPTWTLPRKRAKNGEEHTVPLTPEVVSIIKGMRKVSDSSFVLTTTGKKPVSGFSKFKVALDRRMLTEARRRAMASGRDPSKVNIPEWRLHDLRRTMATVMADRLGTMPHIVEAVLNHASGHKAGVAGVYNRARYRPQVRAALAAWAAEVHRIVTAQSSSNVVPFRTAM